jgi:hypothetical protein
MAEYLQFIAGIISGVLIFITGRKTAKTKEIVEKSNAVDAMQATYDVFLKHYKLQYDNLLIRLDGLELRNAILMESAETWENKFKLIERKYNVLEKDFEAYKKKHLSNK